MKAKFSGEVIECVRWSGANVQEVVAFLGNTPNSVRRGGQVKVGPSGSSFVAEPGDWILRYPSGLVSSTKPKVFEATCVPIEQ